MVGLSGPNKGACLYISAIAEINFHERFKEMVFLLPTTSIYCGGMLRNARARRKDVGSNHTKRA